MKIYIDWDKAEWYTDEKQFFEADNRILHHLGKWIFFVMTFCYNLNGLEDNELNSQLHEHEGK